MKQINSFSCRLLCIVLLAITHTPTQAQSIVAAGYTFSASSSTYTYLTGGTTLPNVQTDDAYDVINIFPFRFCGNTYTNLLLCANGWMKFGTVPTYIDLYMNRNNVLSEGQYPCIYPLYEDINGDIGTSTYKITGTPPNRVFVWECRDFKWDYAATTASVSFQVWLYEATSIIECIYKQESGTVVLNSSGGATIGIANSSSDWQVLDGSGTNPTSSSTTYTYNIGTRPATGQKYTWDPGPPCAAPTTINVNLLNSMYVDFSWTPATSSLGYEYVVSTNASGPLVTDALQSTSNTNANKGGLTPNTQYYIHVRNKCGTFNFSQWVTRPIMTLPACVIAAPGITLSYIDSNSATLVWQGAVTLVEYQYTVRETNTTPSPTDPDIKTTTLNGVSLTPLTPGKTYYTFLRIKCQGSDSSSWLVDSFYVPIPCRPPAVQLTDVTDSRMVASWAVPLSAYEYEIINSSAPISNPVTGIKTVHNSYLFPFLDNGKQYYVYARSYCEDRGVKTISNWSTTTATTWALSADEMSKEGWNINIYPNPVQNQLTVTVQGAIGKAGITVCDITGKKMITVETNNGMQTVINTSMLPAGIYVLQYTDQAHTKFMKFDKQ